MNYLGFAALLIAMIWTWKAPKTDRPPLVVHTEIQNKVSELITSAVTQLRPETATLKLDRVWTEAKSTNLIKVSFKYSLAGDDGEDFESHQGHALAKKTGDGEWLLKSVKVDKTNLLLPSTRVNITQ